MNGQFFRRGALGFEGDGRQFDLDELGGCAIRREDLSGEIYVPLRVVEVFEIESIFHQRHETQLFVGLEADHLQVAGIEVEVDIQHALRVGGTQQFHGKLLPGNHLQLRGGDSQADCTGQMSP